MVADEDTPDLAAGIEAQRIGVFGVEDVIVGDARKFAEARWDVISQATAEKLCEQPSVHDAEGYALVIDPQLDAIAESVDSHAKAR